MESQLLSRGHYGLDPVSTSYSRFTAMNTEPSNRFCPLGSGQEPSTWCTPLPTPRCLPFFVSVLPLPWLLPLPEWVPSYVLNSGTTSPRDLYKLMNEVILPQSLRAHEYRSRRCRLNANRLPCCTSAHLSGGGAYFNSSCVWEMRLWRDWLLRRGENENLGLGTQSTCKEQWFNETAGWILTGFLKENEGKQNKQKKPTLQIGLEPFSIPLVEVLRVKMRPKDQRHTSGTIWASFLLEKIRTIFQSRLDNQMHIANNSIQRRQKGDTSRLPGNGSPSLGEGGKEEVSVWENSPVVTVVSATYSPITEGTRLRTLRGLGGWETVCSAENCHHNAWTVFFHPLPKNNEMARIQRSVILSSCFDHWQLITDSFNFYSAFIEHSHPWCEGR